MYKTACLCPSFGPHNFWICHSDCPTCLPFTKCPPPDHKPDPQFQPQTTPFRLTLAYQKLRRLKRNSATHIWRRPQRRSDETKRRLEAKVFEERIALIKWREELQRWECTWWWCMFESKEKAAKVWQHYDYNQRRLNFEGQSTRWRRWKDRRSRRIGRSTASWQRGTRCDGELAMFIYGVLRTLFRKLS